MHSTGKSQLATNRGVQLEVQAKARRRRKEKPIREDDGVEASAMPVQPPLKRDGEDDHSNPSSLEERPVLREPDPPVASGDPVQVPIQRPDPDPTPVVPPHPGRERGAEG